MYYVECYVFLKSAAARPVSIDMPKPYLPNNTRPDHKYLQLAKYS